MARYHLSTTHLWAEQQISMDRRTFLHRQCQICRRDFVRSLDEGEWRTVHVGVLKFDFLNEETSRNIVRSALILEKCSWPMILNTVMGFWAR
jgi:hypothetical protein